MIDHTRHIGIFYAQNFTATLIGAGGIGAITAITLAKMGLGELHIFDTDEIEDVNVATQFYGVSDIGSSKLEALASAVYHYSHLAIVQHPQRVTKDTHLPQSHIIISGVDSIISRQEIFQAVLSCWGCHQPGGLEQASVPNQWYIDARMSSEYLQVYAMNNLRYGWYSHTLEAQKDEDIPDEPCTSKATIYTACLAAGVIGALVRKIITGDQLGGILTFDIFTNQMMWTPMEI